MRRGYANVALAVVLAACGGGSDETAETPAPAEASAPAEAAVTTEAPATSVSPDPAVDETEAAPVDAEAPATTVPPTTAPTPIEVPEKLQHVGDAVGGGELDLSVYAGRDTIAWFWAPW